MIYLINYADSAYKCSQKSSTKYAYKYGGVESVIEYGPSDIDSSFYEENKVILSKKRGAGLWLWKPYIVLKQLELINEGDYLVYLDSGAILINNINNLIKNMKSDFYFSRLPLFDINYTSNNVLDYFNNDGNSQQILATFFVLRKSSRTLEFAKKWLNLCCDINLLDGDNSGDNLIAHREDQSILSMLVKQENIDTHTDPSQFGFFPSKYIIQNKKHVYIKENFNENSKIIIFCHRQKKVNLILKIKMLIYRHMPKFLLYKELTNNKL